jgi:dolichyl-phosphate beta-glucosyltransferase
MCYSTIVVPCYNEANRLDVQAFLGFAHRDAGCRFLFVNDGSTDGTLPILQGLSRAGPGRFRVLDLPRNLGKAEAVRRGVLEAAGSEPERIGYWDADLATPLAAIGDFSRVLDEHPRVQVVLGSRVRLLGRSIHRRVPRHYLGRAFATAASLALRIPVYDTQCGAKLFRATPEIVSLFDEPFRSRWIFDVELLARFIAARRPADGPAEERLYELPLTHWEDVAGSKLRLRHFLRAALELTAIGLELRARRQAADAAGRTIPFPVRTHRHPPDKEAA